MYEGVASVTEHHSVSEETEAQHPGAEETPDVKGDGMEEQPRPQTEQQQNSENSAGAAEETPAARSETEEEPPVSEEMQFRSGEAVIVHPLAAMFPGLPATQFEELKADIKENGVLIPVVFVEKDGSPSSGMLLDGVHRMRAWQELGFDPDDCPYEEIPAAEALAYAVSTNMNRRHLTDDQRAMLSARVASWKKNHETVRVPDAGDSGAADQPPRLTSEEIEQTAEMMNVKPRDVRAARGVIDRAAEDVIDAVDAGELGLYAAERAAAKPEEVQTEALRRKQEKESDRALGSYIEEVETEIAGQGSEEPSSKTPARLFVSDFMRPGEWEKRIPDGKVDVIFAHRETNTETETGLYASGLNVFAQRALKDGGHLFAACKIDFLPAMLAGLSSRGGGLAYVWALDCKSTGPRRKAQAAYFTQRLLIAHYVKGPVAPVAEHGLADCLTHAPGELAAVDELLAGVAGEGSLVVDPTAGSGMLDAGVCPVGMSAYEMGCRFIGFDVKGSGIAEAASALEEAASGGSATAPDQASGTPGSANAGSDSVPDGENPDPVRNLQTPS